jgi:hypothetical protein
VRTQAAPPSNTSLCPISGPIEYCNSIPALLQSSCAPGPSMFAGPSPGTMTRRHGRHHLSSPAILRHLSWCTSPTREHSRSCRSCRTSSSPTKPSSPARTRRSDATAVVFPRQGLNCSLGLCIRVPYARNQGPLCETLLLFHVCKAAKL